MLHFQVYVCYSLHTYVTFLYHFLFFILLLEELSIVPYSIGSVDVYISAYFGLVNVSKSFNDSVVLDTCDSTNSQ